MVNSNTGWNVTVDADWLSVDPVSGSGDKSVKVTATENTSGTDRSATIRVTWSGGTEVITVTQKAQGDYLSLTTNAMTFSSKSDPQYFMVNSNTGWNVTVDADWLSVDPVSGNGDKSVKVTVSENTSNTSREAKIFVKWSGGTEVVEVMQFNDVFSLVVSPDSWTFNERGGEQSISVRSNLTWEAVITEISEEGWLTIEKVSNDELKLIALPLSGNQERNAIVKVSGGELSKEIKVNQIKGSFKFEVYPTEIPCSYNGFTKTITVKSNVSWEAKVTSSTSDWLQVENGRGVNDGEFSIVVEPNTGENGREAEVSVFGGGVVQPIKVKQDGTDINPTNANDFDIEDNDSFIIDSDGSLLVEYNKDVTLVLCPEGGDNFSVDKWNYEWQVGNDAENIISIARRIDKTMRYTFKAKMSYKLDDRIFFEKEFQVYPKPSQPELVLKGNGTSRILIAKMNDGIYDTFAGHKYIFGHGNSEDANRDERYYQYKNGLLNNHWVKYQWTIEGKVIDSEKGFLIGVPQNRSISIRNAHLVAHCETPTPAIVTVLSFSGKTRELMSYSASCDFDEQIDLHNLPSGLYIIRATIGDQQAEEKVVVK